MVNSDVEEPACSWKLVLRNSFAYRLLTVSNFALFFPASRCDRMVEFNGAIGGPVAKGG
jgi:hypothetical protein